MRLLIFLSLAFFACAVPALSQESSDREKSGFKGPVKTVRTKSTNPEVNHEISFDREGRKVEEAYYESDDKLFRRSVFTYDSGGYTEESYKPDRTLHHRVFSKVEFDKARGTSRTTVTGELNGYDGLYTVLVNKYDSLGHLAEGLSYDRDGKLQSRSVWKYGADGGLEEFVYYNGAGSVRQRVVWMPEEARIFVYGDDGALVSTETRGRLVCTESDQYGNCKRGTTARSINKAGKVEEVTAVSTHTFTYY